MNLWAIVRKRKKRLWFGFSLWLIQNISPYVWYIFVINLYPSKFVHLMISAFYTTHIKMHRKSTLQYAKESRQTRPFNFSLIHRLYHTVKGNHIKKKKPLTWNLSSSETLYFAFWSFMLCPKLSNVLSLPLDVYVISVRHPMPRNSWLHLANIPLLKLS